MIDLRDLRLAAGALASAEVKARLVHDRLRRMAASDPGYGAVKGLLAEKTAQVEALTRAANELRASIGEAAGKSYWWDIPFDVDRPAPVAEGFSFPDGYYLEVRFDPRAGSPLLDSKRLNPHASLYMNTFSPFPNDYADVPLYLNRKRFRAHFGSCLEVRPIYHVMEIRGEFRTVSHIDTSPSPAAMIMQAYHRRAAAARQETREQVDAYNHRQDDLERMVHNSFWTNEERWFAGQMASEDYYAEQLWRDYGETSITSKARDRDSDDHFLSSLRAIEANRGYSAGQRRGTASSPLVRLMKVGEAVYHGEELLALVVHQQECPVEEVQCGTDFSAASLSGSVFDVKHLFYRKPDLAPVIGFLLRQYAGELARYNPLKPRPTGCPDGLWRVWAEARWALSLQQAEIL